MKYTAPIRTMFHVPYMREVEPSCVGPLQVESVPKRWVVIGGMVIL